MNELRLKQLKKGWMPIQETRESIKQLQIKRDNARAVYRSACQKVAEKSKELDKLLDSFESSMV